MEWCVAEWVRVRVIRERYEEGQGRECEVSASTNSEYETPQTQPIHFSVLVQRRYGDDGRASGAAVGACGCMIDSLHGVEGGLSTS